MRARASSSRVMRTAWLIHIVSAVPHRKHIEWQSKIRADSNLSGAIMKPSSIFSVRPSVFAVALIVLGVDTIHAQVTPGAGGSIIGQPPGQSPSSIIGQPVPGQPGSASGQPAPGQGGVKSMQRYPGAGSTGGRDVTRDALDRANRDAADINLDGRIDPGEAARMPGGSPQPGVPSGSVPLPR